MIKKHNTKEWFQNAFKIKGSIIPRVIYRSLFCGIFAGGISYLDAFKYEVQLPVLSSVIPSVVIGLLLVFRTNTAYERFWEGRKLWSMIDINSRNLARQILVIIEENNIQDTIDKKNALRLIGAFSVATKQKLRRENKIEQFEQFLTKNNLYSIKNSTNKPTDILVFLQDYLQTQMHKGNVLINQVSTMQSGVNNLLEGSIGCQRILDTPIPIAYSIHLKQLLLLYCLTLPFQFVNQLGLWTGPIVFLVSIALLGIEAIGMEIENPFGTDENDINMSTLSKDIVSGIDEITGLEPNSPKYKITK